MLKMTICDIYQHGDQNVHEAFEAHKEQAAREEQAAHKEHDAHKEHGIIPPGQINTSPDWEFDPACHDVLKKKWSLISSKSMNGHSSNHSCGNNPWFPSTIHPVHTCCHSLCCSLQGSINCAIATVNTVPGVTLEQGHYWTVSHSLVMHVECRVSRH